MAGAFFFYKCLMCFYWLILINIWLLRIYHKLLLSVSFKISKNLLSSSILFTSRIFLHQKLLLSQLFLLLGLYNLYALEWSFTPRKMHFYALLSSLFPFPFGIYHRQDIQRFWNSQPLVSFRSKLLLLSCFKVLKLDFCSICEYSSWLSQAKSSLELNFSSTNFSLCSWLYNSFSYIHHSAEVCRL